MTHFAFVRTVFLWPHQRLQTERAHQALNSLVVDLLAQLPNRRGDASIAVSPFVAGEDGADLLLQRLMLVAGLRCLLLVVEGAARQAGQLEQAGQREVLP